MSTKPETRNTLHQVGKLSLQYNFICSHFLNVWILFFKGCIPLLVQLIYNQDGGGESSSHQDRANHCNNTSNSWMLIIAQFTTIVLRNLSWRADSASKKALQQTSVVQSLITTIITNHE